MFKDLIGEMTPWGRFWIPLCAAQIPPLPVTPFRSEACIPPAAGITGGWQVAADFLPTYLPSIVLLMGTTPPYTTSRPFLAVTRTDDAYSLGPIRENSEGASQLRSSSWDQLKTLCFTAQPFLLTNPAFFFFFLTHPPSSHPTPGRSLGARLNTFSEHKSLSHSLLPGEPTCHRHLQSNIFLKSI